MLPVLFKIGPFTLHSWGLLLLVAFLAATFRAVKRAPRYGIAPDAIWDCSLIGLLGGIVGGRLAFVAQQASYFASHPGEILAIWTGGMTSFGGLIGGVAAGVWAAKRRGIKVGDAADLTAVSLPIGYAIGRIGCFLNGCCHGSKCSLPWAVEFKHDGGVSTGLVHPAQLYSAIAGLLIYGVLVLLERRRTFPGQLLLVFMALYGVYRFLVEFVREGATAEVLAAGLTTGQIASLATVIAAGIAMVVMAKRRNA